MKTNAEDHKTLSKSVAGAGCTDPTFEETASEPEETITSQNAPETLATTTTPISVPVPQGISEEIVKLVKDRIDFLEAVEAAKCSTWYKLYRQIMQMIQNSKNPKKISKQTKHQKKNKNPQGKKKKIPKKTSNKKVNKKIMQDNVMKPVEVDKKKENIQDHESIVHGIVDEIISNAIGQGPEQVDKNKENIQDQESIVHGILDEIISNAVEEAETSEADEIVDILLSLVMENAKEPGGWREASEKTAVEKAAAEKAAAEKSAAEKAATEKATTEKAAVIGGSVDILMRNEPGLSFEPIEQTVLPVFKQEIPESNPVPLPIHMLQPVTVPILVPVPVLLPTQAFHNEYKGQEKQFQAESIQLLADGPENGGLTTDANFGQNRHNAMAMHHMSIPEYQPTHMKPFGQGEWGRVFQEYNRQCQISDQQSAVAKAKKIRNEVQSDIAAAKKEIENSKPMVGGDATALVHTLVQLNKFLEEWQQPAAPKVKIDVHKDPKDPKFEMEVNLAPFLCTKKNVARAVSNQYIERYIIEEIFEFATKQKEEQFAKVRQLNANLKDLGINWDPREKFPELEQKAMKEKYLPKMANMSETRSPIPPKQKLSKQRMDNQQPNLKNYLKKESKEFIQQVLQQMQDTNRALSLVKGENVIACPQVSAHNICFVIQTLACLFNSDAFRHAVMTSEGPTGEILQEFFKTANETRKCQIASKLAEELGGEAVVGEPQIVSRPFKQSMD